MRTFTFCIVFLCIAVFSSFSQSFHEIIASSGGFFENIQHGSISFTIGEPVIETIGNYNYTLTQGFQQGDLVPVFVNENMNIDVDLKIYPNPARNNIFVQVIASDNKESFRLEIFDVIGNKIINQKIKSGISELSIQHMNSGIYLVNIYYSSEILSISKLIIK